MNTTPTPAAPDYKKAMAELEDITRRASTGAATIPAGWKLVPDTATHNMLNAANAGRKRGRSSSGDIYSAMLAAGCLAPIGSETAGPVELPPLPEPLIQIPGEQDLVFGPAVYYSADQMRAYARAALAAKDSA